MRALAWSLLVFSILPIRIAKGAEPVVDDVGESHGNTDAAPQRTMESESQTPLRNPREVKRSYRTGKILAASGTATWATGVVLISAGIITAFQTDELSDVPVAIGLVASGLTLDVFGPIPCVVGEKMVKNRVGQRNVYKLGGTSGMSSAPVYGISVGMTVMGAALTVVPQRPVWIMGLVIAGTGEVLRGLSAIAPLARISRHERRHPIAWAVAPIWIPQGMKGLAVGARF